MAALAGPKWFVAAGTAFGVVFAFTGLFVVVGCRRSSANSARESVAGWQPSRTIVILQQPAADRRRSVQPPPH